MDNNDIGKSQNSENKETQFDYLQQIKRLYKKNVHTIDKNKSYTLTFTGQPDIPEVPTSIVSRLPVYPLDHEIIYKLLKEGRLYENIDMIESSLSEELDVIEEIESDMLKNNIILNEDESELFLQELNRLHYNNNTLEFYKSSTQILKKIKNGEFIIDL